MVLLWQNNLFNSQNLRLLNVFSSRCRCYIVSVALICLSGVGRGIVGSEVVHSYVDFPAQTLVQYQRREAKLLNLPENVCTSLHGPNCMSQPSLLAVVGGLEDYQVEKVPSPRHNVKFQLVVLRPEDLKRGVRRFDETGKDSASPSELLEKHLDEARISKKEDLAGKVVYESEMRDGKLGDVDTMMDALEAAISEDMHSSGVREVLLKALKEAEFLMQTLTALDLEDDDEGDADVYYDDDDDDDDEGAGKEEEVEQQGSATRAVESTPESSQKLPSHSLPEHPAHQPALQLVYPPSPPEEAPAQPPARKPPTGPAAVRERVAAVSAPSGSRGKAGAQGEAPGSVPGEAGAAGAVAGSPGSQPEGKQADVAPEQATRRATSHGAASSSVRKLPAGHKARAGDERDVRANVMRDTLKMVRKRQAVGAHGAEGEARPAASEDEDEDEDADDDGPGSLIDMELIQSLLSSALRQKEGTTSKRKARAGRVEKAAEA